MPQQRQGGEMSLIIPGVGELDYSPEMDFLRRKIAFIKYAKRRSYELMYPGTEIRPPVLVTEWVDLETSLEIKLRLHLLDDFSPTLKESLERFEELRCTIQPDGSLFGAELGPESDEFKRVFAMIHQEMESAEEFEDHLREEGMFFMDLPPKVIKALKGFVSRLQVLLHVVLTEGENYVDLSFAYPEDISHPTRILHVCYATMFESAQDA
jgi:hypothetical protein